jgi:lipoprotein-anchoring transpeptidase ErfK/SrfK
MTSRTIAVVGLLAGALLVPGVARADDPPPQQVAPADAESAPNAEAPPAAVRAPSRRRGSTVARIVAPAFARARLDSPRRGTRLSVQTAWAAQPQVLLVLDTTSRRGREWVKVLLPRRPNGSAGWVPRDKVVLERARYWIDVRLGARRVTVYRDGKRVRRVRAVVGAPGTPTPHGLAAVWERNRQPSPRGPLGPWALSLTALSDVLKSFGGGPGRIGIHGHAGASLHDPRGSHGCVRVSNRQIARMAREIPLGTPVRIRR